MAKNITRQPCTGETVRQLRQAERTLAAWIQRLESGDDAAVYEAARLANITQATINEAACDTRDRARHPHPADDSGLYNGPTEPASLAESA